MTQREPLGDGLFASPVVARANNLGLFAARDLTRQAGHDLLRPGTVTLPFGGESREADRDAHDDASR